MKMVLLIWALRLAAQLVESVVAFWVLDKKVQSSYLRTLAKPYAVQTAQRRSVGLAAAVAVRMGLVVALQ